MILGFARQHSPSALFLDAPLSLPGVYALKQPHHTDYFHRDCDKQLNAMSPMFLGGLTARAMKLASTLRASGVPVFETYPKWHAKRLKLDALGYKKQPENLERCTLEVAKTLEGTLSSSPTSWHEFDALLALLTGLRFREGKHLQIGDTEEGKIYL